HRRWTKSRADEPLAPPSGGGLELHPTATPEGQEDTGATRSREARRIAGADRRTVDHLGGATRRAADGAAGVRTDRKAGRHRTALGRPGAGRPQRQSGTRGSGDRTAGATAE